MTITLTRPYCRIAFTWADDMSSVTFVVMGEISDEDIAAILAADGHEGADVDGWTTTIS